VATVQADEPRPEDLRLDKRGGYTGGRPARTVPPPAKVPSAAVLAQPTAAEER
jgi:hypothetical protein